MKKDELLEKFEKKFGKSIDGKYSGDLYLSGYGFALPKDFTGGR